MTIPAVYPGIWASHFGDPFFSDVVNLSHFDGINGSTTFVDSSSHATNLPALGSGNLNTSVAKFGSAALACPTPSGVDGAGNGGLALYSIGTNDYTIEFFVRPNTFSGAQNICYWDVAAGGPTGLAIVTVSGDLRMFINGATVVTGSALNLSAYNFIAYSRIGTTGNLYLNGSGIGSITDSFNYASDSLYLGCFAGGTNGLNGGLIDEFRFTIGKGRYSGSTCPVPTAEFPNNA